MPKDVWNRVKKVTVTPVQAEPDKNSKHPGAISGGRINFHRPSFRYGRISRKA